MRGCDVDAETELVSGSSDGNTIVWNLNDEVAHYTLTESKENVNVVDGLYCGKDQQDTVVVSVPMDSTIKIWYRHKIGSRDGVYLMTFLFPIKF